MRKAGRGLSADRIPLDIGSRKRIDARSDEGEEFLSDEDSDSPVVDPEFGMESSPKKVRGLRKRSAGCIRKSASARLVHVKETPEWYQPRQHVSTGYRIGHTWRDCVVGLFELHGETVNVWTHVIALPVTVLTIVELATHPLADKMPWVVVTAGVLCLSTSVNLLAWSVLAHAFHCLSPWHQNQLWCIDIVSIKFVWLARAAMELYLLLFRWELVVVPAALMAAAFAFLVPLAVNFGDVTKKSPRHELFAVLALLGQMPTVLHGLLAYRPRAVAAGCWALLQAGAAVGLVPGTGVGGSDGWELSPSIRPDTDHGPAAPEELVAAARAADAAASSETGNGLELTGEAGSRDGSSVVWVFREVLGWFTEGQMGPEGWRDVASVLGPAAVDGVQGQYSRTAVQFQVLSTAIGFLAMVVYASHVPERWFPGRFDLVGSSHNVWHILGALSPLVWMWVAAPALMEWRWGAEVP